MKILKLENFFINKNKNEKIEQKQQTKSWKLIFLKLLDDYFGIDMKYDQINIENPNSLNQQNTI